MTIDLRPAKLDIEAIAGNDITLVVTVTDDEGAAINVSGYTIQADVYESGTSVATFTDSVGGASNNEITLSLTDTQTTTLGADSSTWLWSLKVTNAGDTREWLAGRFRLYEPGAAGNTTTTAVALTAGSVSVSVSAIGTGAGGGGGDVTSVNGATGVVVLDADDISDTSTTKKFTTAAEITKLAGIETGAEVNDTAAEILAKLVTVDGAGSGLDADTLDGLSSAAFATASGLSDHLADTTDAHDASAISIVDTGGYFTGTDVETALQELGAGGGGGAVDSVNGATGVVVLDADDIDDAATTNKFATAAELTKLSGIETAADVTDETNVRAAGGVIGDGVDDIVKLTQAAYDALTPVATTLYVIVA